MKKFRVAIIGAGTEGSSLYNCLVIRQGIEIAGIADISGGGACIEDACKNGIPVFESIEDIFLIKDLFVIFETTNRPDILKKINKLKRPGVYVLEEPILSLFFAFNNQNNSAEAQLQSLTTELKRSTTIIENIYDNLNQLNGFSLPGDSDVISMDRMEQILLRQALTRYGYSVEGKKMAAKALNISLATLYNKLKKYQIS